MLFKRTLEDETWENFKKTEFGPDFDPFGQYLGPQNFFRGFYLY